MEVKSILEKIRKNEEEPLRSHFALLIEPEVIKGAIFVFDENEIDIVSVSDSFSLSQEASLLEISDKVFSSALESIDKGKNIKEPETIVFGLPASWVEEEKVNSEKLKVLREVCQGLDLKPTGFVVSNEALIHQLKKKEGIPPTAILVYLLDAQLMVSLVKLGKIIGSKTVERSDEACFDLIEGLSRFDQEEPMPVRVIVFGREEELDDVRQSLISYQWMDEDQDHKINFLHLPQIETLDQDFDIRAVAFAGGTEYAKTLGMSVLPKEPEEMEEEEKPIKEPALEVDRESDSGFVNPEEIGFEKEPVIERGEEIEEEEPEKPVFEPDPVVLDRAPEEEKNSSNILKAMGGKLLLIVKKIPLPRFSFLSKGRMVVPIVIGALALIFAGLLVAWWRIPKVSVTLFVEPKTLEKKFEIRLDPSGAEVSNDELVLLARQLSVQLKSEKKKTVTGSKLIGDPAEGEITIYNGTSGTKTFEKGTAISSPTGIEFELKDDVQVASQSSAADPPGTAKVSIIAVKIGVEGNLAANTEFLISNYTKTDYVAKNESSFTGGVSREIQAVSEEDKDDLLSLLKEELKGQVLQRLKEEAGEKEEIVEESIEEEVSSVSFDKNVGDEAEALGLSLEITAKALVYVEDDMRELVEEEMTSLIPENYEYLKENTNFSFELSSLGKDGSALFDVLFKADLMPKVDVKVIAESLAGKRPEIADVYLGSLNGVVSHSVSFKPVLPGRLQIFPRLVENIDIKVGFKP